MVFEKSDCIETILADEIKKLCEVLIGLSGESDDEGSPQERSFEGSRNHVKQRVDLILVVESPHPFQDRLGYMLKWDIEIGDESLELLQALHVTRGQIIRIHVQEAETEIAFDGIESFQQLDQGWPSVKVFPIPGRILSNQDDFLDIIRDHCLRFCDDILDGSRALPAPDFRDDAERALIIASFGDFEIFVSEGAVDVGADLVSLPDECLALGLLRADALDELPELPAFQVLRMLKPLPRIRLQSEDSQH